MATQYPYVSGAAGLIKSFEQLRKNPPTTLDAAWFKRFGIAPGNESYLITILRFIGLYDEDGNRVEANTDFLYGSDDKFAAGLEERLRDSYSALFSDHGEGAWSESKEDLTRWFRVSDKTSELTGGRQATTFLNLAALAGHGSVPAVSTSNGGRAPRATKSSAPAKKSTSKKASEPVQLQADPVVHHTPRSSSGTGVGLTVRIEVNLPADASPETYDSIFASVRKHLIDRE